MHVCVKRSLSRRPLATDACWTVRNAVCYRFASHQYQAATCCVRQDDRSSFVKDSYRLPAEAEVS